MVNFIFFVSTRAIVLRLLLLFWSVSVFSETFSQSAVIVKDHASTSFFLYKKVTGKKGFSLSFVNYQEVSHQVTAFQKDSSDRDNDGIVDSLDKCPDEKGVIEYDGCPIPDSDNDGVADNLDDCPTIRGLIKYKGCPPGDRDGDKINDEDDKCPDQPGVARYNGCLIIDTDGDGVNDDDDKCKTTQGTLSNAGCPEDKSIRSGKKQKKTAR